MFLILLALIWLAAFILTARLHHRGRLRSPWHFDVAALGLLGLAALGFFWRIVAGLNWMPADGGDLVSFLFPTYRFAAASLRDGAWPLWNPHVYAGAPHVGDIQAGFLYLPNLLLFLLNPTFPYESLQWLSVAHLWFAGAGMYFLLARGLGLRRVAALAGAIAFMFSDGFLTHFGNLNLNASLSWLPWVFWGWIASRSLPLRVGLTAALLALSLTAGHIQGTLFIILALSLYAFFALLAERNQPRFGRSALLTAVALAGAVALACLLAAPVLLPALELASRTMRAAGTYTATGDYPLSPPQLIGWLIPGFFGRGPQFHWGAWPRVEVGYLGILPLILAGVGVALRGRTDRRVWPWVGLAGVSLILALGVYAILYGWLTLLPGFNQLRAAARFVLLTGFALSALAAFGLDALLRPLSASGERALARLVRVGAWIVGGVLLLGVPLAYLALLLLQDRDTAVVTRVSITLIAVVSFALLLAASVAWLAARRWHLGRPVTLAWLAVALIFVDVASLGAYQDMGERNPAAAFEQGPIAAFLTAQPGPFRIDSRTQIDALWQPNTALLYGLEDVNGVANPLVLADFERYWEALGSRSTPLYDLLNVRYVLGKKDVALDWDKFALAFDGDPDLNVYENRRALPRAFIVPTAQFQPSADLALQTITQPGFDPKQTAVIEGPSTLPVPVGGGGTVSGIEVHRNSLRFSVNTDAPALVFVSQIWYPGWQVFIDGQRAGEPYRANFLFQAVGAPAGAHQVELRFMPVAWRIGWALMAVAVLAFIVAGLWLARARRKGE